MSGAGTHRSATAKAIEDSVRKCMDRGSWRSYTGESLDLLTSWFRSELGLSHVRLCCSGTFAVELALRSLHLSADDEVILSSYDYPGNFRAIDRVGARVVLCDPAPDSGWSLSVDRLEQCVAPNTRALIVSHLHGDCARMPEIMEWAQQRRILVIEDACQSQGGSLNDVPLGAWGDIGIFSFGGSKLISAGRGGVAVTKHDIYAQRMRLYCERDNDAYALSEIQAAIVLPQCQHLSEDHETRLFAAKQFMEEVQKISWLGIAGPPSEASPAFYKIGLSIEKPYCELIDREKWFTDLQLRGIQIGPGFLGFANRSPKRFRTPHTLDRARELASTTLVLNHNHLMDPNSGKSSIDIVLEALKSPPL